MFEEWLWLLSYQLSHLMVVSHQLGFLPNHFLIIISYLRDCFHSFCLKNLFVCSRQVWTSPFLCFSFISRSFETKLCFSIYKIIFACSLTVWGSVRNQNVRILTESQFAKLVLKSCMKMKVSSASLPEETAKCLLIPCISHQPMFYSRASQQLCISLHVLFMLCVLSSIVSRHFSAVVVHLSILFVLAVRPVSLLSTFVITFLYLYVFLKISLLRLSYPLCMRDTRGWMRVTLIIIHVKDSWF